MNNIYDFLATVNPDIFIAIVLTALFTLEQLFFNAPSFSKRAPHLVTNILLQAGYTILNYGLALLVVKFFDWISVNKIGLFNIISIPNYIKIPLGILSLDFVNYWAHRLYHSLEVFWRLHRVHHSDTTLDTSSAYRFHPLDAVLDNCAGIVAALLFGFDPFVLIIWLILYIPVLVLHHSKFIMPNWFDKTFGLIIVSPNFHKIHHHQLQEFTDSNYGLLFIFWDKIFKTFKKIPVSEIKFGLKEFDDSKRQQIGFLLKSPFLNLKK